MRSNTNGYVNAILVDISTTQTLAPNYYEIIQINDFLWAVEAIAELDVKGGSAFREMPSLPFNESQGRLDEHSVSEALDDDQSQELMEDESRSR